MEYRLNEGEKKSHKARIVILGHVDLDNQN